MFSKTIDQTFEEIIALMEDFILVENDHKMKLKQSQITTKDHKNYFGMLIHRMKHAY